MSNSLAPKIGSNVAAIAVLVFATLVFAINTFDLFSIFYIIAEEFNGDVSMLGMISAAMVEGIGLLQIPAGILASKYGPKNVAILGMIIIGISTGLVGISTDLYQIAAFRLVLGGGLAFFLPSAIVLGVQHFRKGSEGLGSGIIVGSNAAGGVLGLVVWVVLAASLGWRISIVMGAILAAIAAVAMYLILPRITVRSGPSFSIKASHIRALISDKYLIIVGITS